MKEKCPIDFNGTEIKTNHIWVWAGDATQITGDYLCECGLMKYGERELLDSSKEKKDSNATNQ